MIVNSKEILETAKKNKYAIPQFNINNLEWAKFILEECNLNNSPVIIGVSESAAKYMGGYKTVVGIIRNLDEYLKIKVPVVIHLDHGSTYEECKKAIDAGFTSVMIDGSKYPLEENIELTKKVVSYAEKFTVTVEAEIGAIGNADKTDTQYASVEDTIKLYEETKVDSIAPAIGSVHGVYKEEPKIDFDRIEKINKNLKIPLVLHGASGIPEEIIKTSIKKGITKINYNTELQIAWSNALKIYLYKNGTIYDPRKIIKSGEKNLKAVVKNKIELLQSNK